LFSFILLLFTKQGKKIRRVISAKAGIQSCRYRPAILLYPSHSRIIPLRGRAMAAREAHKILWRRIVMFCGKFPKLLGTPERDNQQPSQIIRKLSLRGA